MVRVSKLNFISLAYKDSSFGLLEVNHHPRYRENNYIASCDGSASLPLLFDGTSLTAIQPPEGAMTQPKEMRESPNLSSEFCKHLLYNSTNGHGRDKNGNFY